MGFVFDHHRRNVLASRAVLTRMRTPSQPKQPREGQATHAVVFVVHGAIEGGGHVRGAGMRHGLNAHDQDRITHACGHHQAGVPERNAT